MKKAVLSVFIMSVVMVACPVFCAETPAGGRRLITSEMLPKGYHIVRDDRDEIRYDKDAQSTTHLVDIAPIEYDTVWEGTPRHSNGIKSRDGKDVLGEDALSLNAWIRPIYDARYSKTYKRPMNDIIKDYVDSGKRQDYGKDVATLELPGIRFGHIYEWSDKERVQYRVTMVGKDEILDLSVGGYNAAYIAQRQADYAKFDPDLKRRCVVNTAIPTLDLAKEMAVKLAVLVNGGIVTKDEVQKGVVLTVTPKELWADGTSTATLHLAAVAADGKPIANTKFELSAKYTLVGDTETDFLLTDQNGIADGTYKAGKRPGANTITVESAAGKAQAEVRQGGVVIEPENKQQLQAYADGKSKVSLLVRSVGFDEKNIANVPIELSLESKELSSVGTIDPVKGVTDKNGILKAVFTSPEIPVEELKGGAAVNIIAQASLGTPAKNIQDVFPINIYTGESYEIIVEKQGYKKPDKIVFQSSFRNGTVSGQVVTPSDGADASQEIPLAYAKASVLATINKKTKPIGSSETDGDGKFKIEFIAEQVTTSKMAEAEIKEPIEIKVDDAIGEWLTKGQNELTKLQTQKITAPKSATLFYQHYYQLLAESKPFNTERQKATEYLVNAPALMSLFLGYIRQFDSANSESLAWSIESMSAAADCIFEIADLGSKVTGMQEGLADYYKNNPTLMPFRDKLDESWGKLKEKATAKLLLEAYDLLQGEYEGIKDKLETYEAMGIPTDSGMIGVKKSAKEIADSYGAQWLFDPSSAIAEKGEAYLKEKMNAFLKNILTGNYPTEVAELLEIGSERIYSGKTTWADYAHPSELARQVYAGYADKHTQLNITNLNRELYRLDFKLAVDTIGKGVVLYRSAVGSMKDPKNFQKNITDSLKEVDTAFGVLDTVYQAYKGRDWGMDCGRARAAMAEVTELITRTK